MIASRSLFMMSLLGAACWMILFMSASSSVSAAAPVQAPMAPKNCLNNNNNNIPSSSSSATNNNNFMPSVFGVSKRLPALQTLRGGAVVEYETLEDVEAAVMKASMEQKLVVIDFSASWCGPCKMIAPLFAELSEQMPDVVFLKIDVDANPDTAAKYNVSAMPTFVFIKGGEVVDRLMGANPARLQELIGELK